MKEFKIVALSIRGEEALDRVLKKRDIESIIPFALKKCNANKDIDYKIEVL